MIAHAESGILKLGVLKSADEFEAQYANAMSKMETVRSEWARTLDKLDQTKERARGNEEQTRRSGTQVQRSEEQRRLSEEHVHPFKYFSAESARLVALSLRNMIQLQEALDKGPAPRPAASNPYGCMTLIVAHDQFPQTIIFLPFISKLTVRLPV
ncbi:hypothetical protein DENSPDRAFT_843983 [Dentipellis sp. KUC8613]|nr:hypothetical protein DENSPDRAFT_843983 [Dentipellis sp. KUC8613]